jgi:hypothetical protein
LPESGSRVRLGSLFSGRLARLGRPVVLPEQTCDAPKRQGQAAGCLGRQEERDRGGEAREAREAPGDSREIASVCLLLRHFIHVHVTDNFCHLFCPFSQVVPWSSPAAPDFLSLLSSSVLFCSVLSLLSSLLSSRFPLLRGEERGERRVPLGPPRLPPVFCLIVCSLSFPHVPLLSPLFLSPCCPSSLPAPRSSRNCVCCSSCLSARQISLRKTT